MDLPSVTKKIGVPFKRMGTTLVAVRRPKNLKPSEGCDGCFYCDACFHRLACSKFDRKDGISVWFKEVIDETISTK